MISIKRTIKPISKPNNKAGNIKESLETPNELIANNSESDFSFWYVYSMAAKDIKGSNKDNILGAIRATNQK